MIHGYTNTFCTYPLPTHALRVECNLPDPNTHIRTSTGQPPLLSTSIFKPEYSIDPTHTGIFDTDVPPDILDAPDASSEPEAQCRLSEVQERELIWEV